MRGEEAKGESRGEGERREQWIGGETEGKEKEEGRWVGWGEERALYKTGDDA